jgi:predicted nucleic acid-binding protein
MRKTIDLLIDTVAWKTRRLLHNDRDFKPMAQHRGLIEAVPRN